MMLNSQTWQQYPLIKDQLVAVNHTLQTHINVAHPVLQAALLTMANRGGKYLRPTMLLLMAKVINDQHENDQQLIHLASSIITTRKTGGLLCGYKPLCTASVSRRWLSLCSSQNALTTSLLL